MYNVRSTTYYTTKIWKCLLNTTDTYRYDFPTVFLHYPDAPSAIMLSISFTGILFQNIFNGIPAHFDLNAARCCR
jgi:hypothetical protein